MNSYLLLIVDDEREVLDSVYEDLKSFAANFDIELAENATEAREVISQAETQGQSLALILCDHVMPGEKGVDFLVSLQQNPSTKAAKKLLITGQAGLQATIQAVNEAGLDYYVAKPWKPEQLQDIVRKQLTDFVIAHDPKPVSYAAILDRVKIFEFIHEKGDDL
ncbi:MAG: response regulator [Oligoflexus sp.]